MWLVTAVAIPTIFATSLPLQAVDLAYQLRAGDLIVSTRALPHDHVFAFTTPGLEWFDQQWGAQVALWAVFSVGGWAALAWLRAALVAAIVWLVVGACRRQGASATTAAMLTLAGAGLFLGASHLRPQLFGMACLAGVVRLVAGRRDRAWALFAVPVVVGLWANLHGSFPLAAIPLGLAVWEDARERADSLRRTIAVALTAVVATFANPYGVRVWSYVASLSTNADVRSFVVEWSSPSLAPSAGVVAAASWAFGAAVIVSAFVVWRSSARDRWFLLGSLVAYALPGALAVRGMFVFGIGAPVVIARALRVRPAGRVRAAPSQLPAVNAAIVTVLLVIETVALGRWAPHLGDDPPEGALTYAPVEMTSTIARAAEPGERVLAAQLWGSWFEYALPRNPVAVDARIEVIPHAEWERYRLASDAREGWPAVLEGWDVRFAALRYDQQAPLIEALRSDAGWRLVLETDDGALFERLAP